MAIPPPNPHSKWYHCFCCMQPKPETSHKDDIQASPAGHWENGTFLTGAPKPTEKFKEEFLNGKH